MPEFKMSKTQETTFNELCSKLASAKTVLEDDQAALDEALSRVNASIDVYNVELAPIRDFVKRFAAEQQEFFDDKSEDFQSGARGTDIASWLEEWQAIDLDDLDTISLDTEDCNLNSDHGDALDNLGSEP